MNKDVAKVLTKLSDAISQDIFKVIEIRYSINAAKLKAKRQQLALKQREFAALCGWTRQYQNQLENGIFDTVSEETAEIVSSVIDELDWPAE